MIAQALTCVHLNRMMEVMSRWSASIPMNCQPGGSTASEELMAKCGDTKEKTVKSKAKPKCNGYCNTVNTKPSTSLTQKNTNYVYHGTCQSKMLQTLIHRGLSTQNSDIESMSELAMPLTGEHVQPAASDRSFSWILQSWNHNKTKFQASGALCQTVSKWCSSSFNACEFARCMCLKQGEAMTNENVGVRLCCLWEKKRYTL